MKVKKMVCLPLLMTQFAWPGVLINDQLFLLALQDLHLLSALDFYNLHCTTVLLDPKKDYKNR